MFTRPATADDADDIARIMIAASPGDPAYTYRYPDRHQRPEAFDRCCRRKVAEYLREATVQVYETASNSNPEKVRVVAFAVWLMPDGVCFDNPDTALPADKATTQPLLAGLMLADDIDDGSARSEAFRRTLRECKASLFDARFQPGQYCFLKQLMCHPDYQRRGAGSTLTKEGMRVARRHGRATALFASPKGHRVYQKLGFEELKSCRVHVSGEAAANFLEVKAMAYP